MNSSGDNTTPVPSRAVVNVRGDPGRAISSGGRDVLRRWERIRRERQCAEFTAGVEVDRTEPGDPWASDPDAWRGDTPRGG